MWEREASSEILPQPAIILHTVGSSNQPLGTDEGRSADVTDRFDMEADLPRKLPCFCILTAHDTWRLEHTPPAVCKANNQSVIGPACHGLLWCPQWVEVHTCFVMRGNNADGDNYQFLIWDTEFLFDIPQFSSSDPSSQSGVPSHSGFTLLMHLLFLHLYVASVQRISEATERGREQQSNLWNRHLYGFLKCVRYTV